MEIDFLGLGRDSCSPAVKEEDVSKDSSLEPTRTLGMRWTFSEKLSMPSQMLSFQASPEEKPGNTIKDSNQKLLANSFQKNVLDMPAQRYYTMNSSPVRQFEAQSGGYNREMRMLSMSSHPGQRIVNAPLIQSQPPVLHSPPIPVGHTMIFPTSRPRIGSTISRNMDAPKSRGASAQLTIFFAGSVHVYDDVSPEKAQAIMSMARNSSSASPLKPVATTEVQPQPTRTSLDEACNGKKSSMLSFSFSHANNNQATVAALTGAPPVAIPQARKASLARFLERRKERTVKASPYGINKSSPERGGMPSDNLSCSANSADLILNPEVGH